MRTENLSTLKIHKLTRAQYDRELEAGRIDATALYLTPDEDSQSDWNASYGEPGHVLNRTHWEEAPVVTTWVVLNESNLAFEDGMSSVSGSFNFVDGAECIILWDGVEYRSVCQRDLIDGLEVFVLGNPMLVSQDENAIDNGQPFGIGYIPMYETISLMSTNASQNSHTVKLTCSLTTQEIHKLDNKYIDAEWMATSATGSYYDYRLLNKPITMSVFGSLYMGYVTMNTANISIGSTVEFTIDGVVYTENVAKLGESLYIGNSSMYLSGEYTDGDPYLCIFDTNMIIVYFATSGNHTISFGLETKVYEQLPQCYISDTLGSLRIYAGQRSNSALGVNATAEGSGNNASGKCAHAEGDNNNAAGYASHAEGSGVDASGPQSHAEGNGGTAEGKASHVEGVDTYASAEAAHAEGESSQALAYASHAEGCSTTEGQYAHAEGLETWAGGEASHAEGKESSATGIASHAEGGSTAEGDYSHAEGYACRAIDDYSHVEGIDSNAEGYASHAEGMRTSSVGVCSHSEGCDTSATGLAAHSEGFDTSATGDHSHAEGQNTQATGDAAHAEGYRTVARAMQHASGKFNTPKTAPATSETQDSTGADAIFMIGCGTSSATKNAFRVSSGGQCYGSTAFSASGADFAELFEWVDGNPNNEDRRGLFVALEGEKIRVANAGDDYIGVISGAQAFIGNSASEEWHDKYMTDVFGAKLSHEIEIPAVTNEDGEIVTPACTAIQYVLNPEYNPDEEYVMRENRKEWGIVGLLGQIVMVDDGTCVVGGRVAPSANGIGTASNDGYRVMKRIDNNHIKVLVK